MEKKNQNDTEMVIDLMQLAKALWHAGVRYRRNDRRLPGSPDIAIGRDKIAVFVDGEFWHGYDWERRKERLVRNRAYWLEKIQENIDRDRRDDGRLRALDWKGLERGRITSGLSG